MAEARIGHQYIDAESGAVMDTWFPRGDRQVRRNCLAKAIGFLEDRFVEVPIPDYAAPVASTEDAWLRLHLLSECAMPPNSMNLEGLFSLLPNIAWTSAGPVLPERLDELRERLADETHHLSVFSIDRFPRMTD